LLQFANYSRSLNRAFKASNSCVLSLNVSSLWNLISLPNNFNKLELQTPFCRTCCLDCRTCCLDSNCGYCPYSGQKLCSRFLAWARHSSCWVSTATKYDTSSDGELWACDFFCIQCGLTKTVLYMKNQ
jgi:hypothetical protein